MACVQARLGLHEGQNILTCSVTSELRGKLTVTASIYLWDHDTKIVVSDIDGTITKYVWQTPCEENAEGNTNPTNRSDLLGHILPVLRMDWSHSGVAQLYTNVVSNGYKILYLTSRSIGQVLSSLYAARDFTYILPDQPDEAVPFGAISSGYPASTRTHIHRPQWTVAVGS